MHEAHPITLHAGRPFLQSGLWFLLSPESVFVWRWLYWERKGMRAVLAFLFILAVYSLLLAWHWCSCLLVLALPCHSLHIEPFLLDRCCCSTLIHPHQHLTRESIATFQLRRYSFFQHNL